VSFFYLLEIKYTSQVAQIAFVSFVLYLPHLTPKAALARYVDKCLLLKREVFKEKPKEWLEYTIPYGDVT
jgi:hypothetical protein